MARSSRGKVDAWHDTAPRALQAPGRGPANASRLGPNPTRAAANTTLLSAGSSATAILNSTKVGGLQLASAAASSLRGVGALATAALSPPLSGPARAVLIGAVPPSPWPTAPGMGQSVAVSVSYIRLEMAKELAITKMSCSTCLLPFALFTAGVGLVFLVVMAIRACRRPAGGSAADAPVLKTRSPTHSQVASAAAAAENTSAHAAAPLAAPPQPEQEGRPRWVLPEQAVLPMASVISFTTFIGSAAFGPFITLWLFVCGFDVCTRSTLLAAYFVGRTLAPPLWGLVADRMRQHHLVLGFLAVSNAVSIALLPLPPLRTFNWQLLLMVASGLSDPGALLEAVLIRTLVWAGRKRDIGRSRAFASLAFGVMTPVAVLICGDDGSGIPILFSVTSVMVLITLSLTSLLPIRQAYTDVARSVASHDTSAKKDTGAEHSSEGGAQLDVGSDGRSSFSWSTRFFVVASLLIGLHSGFNSALAFVFYYDELHASGLQLGLIEAIPAVLQVGLRSRPTLTSTLITHAHTHIHTSQVILFINADSIVRCIGTRTAIGTALLAGAIRHAAYVFVDSSAVLLPFEACWAWTFVIEFTLRAYISDDFAQQGMQSTMIGFFSFCRQYASLLTILFIAFPVEAFGMRATFAISAIALGVPALIILLSAVWPRYCGAPGLRRSRSMGYWLSSLPESLANGGQRNTDAVFSPWWFFLEYYDTR
jgi:hypothetical protein